MTRAIAKPRAWVVSAGLTRRLVEADTAFEARRLFLVAVPRGEVLAGALEAVSVRKATDADFVAFSRRRTVPPETLTLPIDLPEPVRKRRARARAEGA